MPTVRRIFPLVAFVVLATTAAAQLAAPPKRLTPKDADRMRTIRDDALSDDGKWLGYLLNEADPRRENGGAPAEPGAAPGGEERPSGFGRRSSTLHLQNLETGKTEQIAGVQAFRFSEDARWLLYTLRDPATEAPAANPGGAPPAAPGAAEVKPAAPEPEGAQAKPTGAEPPAPPEAATKPAGEEPKAGETKALVPEGAPGKPEPKTAPAEVKVEAGEAKPAPAESKAPPAGSEPAAEAKPPVAPAAEAKPAAAPVGGTTARDETRSAPRARGSILVVRELATGRSFEIKNVEQYVLSADGLLLAYVVTPAEAEAHGVFVRDLAAGIDGTARALHTGKARYSNLSWTKDGGLLSWFADPAPPGTPATPASTTTPPTPPKSTEAAPSPAEVKAARTAPVEGEPRPAASAVAVAKAAESAASAPTTPSPAGGAPEATAEPAKPEVPAPAVAETRTGSETAPPPPAGGAAPERRGAFAGGRPGGMGGGRGRGRRGAGAPGAGGATPPAETPSSTQEAAAPARPAEPSYPSRLFTWSRGADRINELVGTSNPGFPATHELQRGSVRFNPDKSKAFVTLRKKPEEPKPAASPAPAANGAAPAVPAGTPVAAGAPSSSVPASSAPAASNPGTAGGAPGTAPRTAPGAAAAAGEGTRGPTGRTGAARAPVSDTAKVDVWHWRDQKIAPMKGRDRGGDNPALLYSVDTRTGALFPLGSERLPNPSLNESCTFGLAADEDPYTHERTWDRDYSDHYLVDVESGQRVLFARRAPRAPQWSSDGSFLLWFENGAWQRVDPRTLVRTNLTGATHLHFEDDEWPGEAMGSVGRILPGGRELLVSDGFDLWAIPLDGSLGRNLTRHGGRDQVRYRHVVLDSDAPWLDGGRSMLLSFVEEGSKAEGYARYDFESGRLERMLVLDKDIGNLRKAKRAERWLVTLQDANEPPDLWLADADFRGLRRVSDANPWLKDYDLPPAELVSWRSDDGEALNGILLYPAGYQRGQRYPTIVYMYEKLSQGLHNFRSIGLQMNPQAWAQAGYAVFMPDIVYQIGRPGLSAVKCVVPGVLELARRGVVDIDRVGLCGHSWGGYETAFIITQTRLFKAAIAGAPVINMVSAYNGIRWSTGIPRQFQYERTQSRIGGSLWEYPERFIANSGIFHLENVTTPVLIMFGNNDGAVPWYQGIEYYLGMRRLGKTAVLLEYKDEGHGLTGRANQEDYTQRIHEWFDHHLKGAAPAPWIEGPKHPEPLPDQLGPEAPKPTSPPPVATAIAAEANDQKR